MDWPDRLFKLRYNLFSYSFKVLYTPGKKNLMAAALSRHPLYRHWQEDDYFDNRLDCIIAKVDKHHMCAFNELQTDPNFEAIMEAARVSTNYQLIFAELVKGVTRESIASNRYKITHPAKRLLHVWSSLGFIRTGENWGVITYMSTRIVVPPSMTADLIKRAHMAHLGIGRTVLALKGRYFWPNMREQVTNFLKNCEVCLKYSRSKPTQPHNIREEDEFPTQPMERVGMDLFQFRGKHFLFLVDEYSGYSLYHEFRKAPTAKQAVEVFKSWCLNYGFPRFARTDWGPQFRGAFAHF